MKARTNDRISSYTQFLLCSAVFVALASRVASAEQAVALIPGNSLLLFDTATPATVTTVAITGLGANETVRGIDLRPATGELYASSVTTAAAANSVVYTYTINPSTGVATLLGSTQSAIAGAADLRSGYDFNPAVDRIRYLNTNDENMRINPNSAALSGNDTDLTPAVTSTVIAAAYDQNTAGTSTATLYVINVSSDNVARIGGVNGSPSPNGGVVTDLGALGIALNAANDGGFDIAQSGIGYLALTNIGTSVTGLYTVNLALGGGGVTYVGAIGTGTTEVYSLAILATDTDVDGIRDDLDNCDGAANSDQADSDTDGTGDACDSDVDGDGLPDAAESSVGSDPGTSDSDGDSKVDGQDACATIPASTTNGCPAVTGTEPETTIASAPSNTRKRRASISFTSSDSDATFECALDQKGFSVCSSPKKYRNLKRGKRTFKVRAISTVGIVDLSPASVSWKVKHKR